MSNDTESITQKIDRNKGYVILVPVRNGRDGLVALQERLTAVAENMADRFGPGELLFVDDGSSDGTWKTILQMSREEEGAQITVRGIKLDRGRGQQSALIAGLTRCKNRSVITMDDDLSHPPEAIPNLLKALDGSIDAAYAIPPKRPGRRVRKTVSRLHQTHISLLTGSPISLRVGSFRAISSGLIDRLLEAPMPFPYLSAQILSLRPRPKVEMVPTSSWKCGDKGRFRLKVLIGMEISLEWHYGPLSKVFYHSSKADNTVFDITTGWIIGETP